jgi:hypothetical protein
MRALDAAGERAAALEHARLYEMPCGQRARREARSRHPRARHQAAGNGIGPERVTPRAAVPATAASSVPSVAVLPFVNTSGDQA